MSRVEFHIVVSTCNRRAILSQAIDSLLSQDYPYWTAYIIDDSTNNKTKKWMQSVDLDARIKYAKNKKNKGVNYSRNQAIRSIQGVDGYVVFLDDDDTFEASALSSLASLIKNKGAKWVITNKTNLTRSTFNNDYFSYVHDYFLKGRITGDAVHAIELRLVQRTNLFCEKIRNGYEFLFFLQLDKRVDPYYSCINTQSCSEYRSDGITSNWAFKWGDIIWAAIEMIKVGRAGLFVRLCLQKTIPFFK